MLSERMENLRAVQQTLRIHENKLLLFQRLFQNALESYPLLPKIPLQGFMQKRQFILEV